MEMLQSRMGEGGLVVQVLRVRVRQEGERNPSLSQSLRDRTSEIFLVAVGAWCPNQHHFQAPCIRRLRKIFRSLMFVQLTLWWENFFGPHAD